MQTQTIHIRLNGVQGQVVDSGNSTSGKVSPSFSRGQKFQLKIGLFDGPAASVKMTGDQLAALAATWGACADKSYGEDEAALEADTVTLDSTNGWLVASFSDTNGERMQEILEGKTKETLICELYGCAENETQPCFVCVFELLAFQRIGTAGIEPAASES